MRPHDEREEAEDEQGVDHQSIAPERLADVRRDDFRDDAHRRQHEHVDLGVSEEPEQVLPQQHVTVAGDSHAFAADDEAARQEEARAGDAIHPLEHGGGLQRGEGQEQQERRDELGPDEEGQAKPGQAGGTQLNDRGDEVQRAQQRREDQAQHAEQPERLSGRCKVRERRIGRPARHRRPAGREEAGEHDDAAHGVEPVAGEVDAWERHVGRADLQRYDVVAERAHRQRHDAEEHHDRAVQRPEPVVHLWGDPGCPARIRKLPAHDDHEDEAHQEEEEAGEAVEKPDDLVVG